MNLFNEKYKYFTVYIFFTGYLFFFGYNILHYHNFNALFSNIDVLCEANSSTIPNGHFVNLEFQCPVHSAYSSLHNVFPNSSGLPTVTINEIGLINPFCFQIYFAKEFFRANALRAPPCIFS